MYLYKYIYAHTHTYIYVQIILIFFQKVYKHQTGATGHNLFVMI